VESEAFAAYRWPPLDAESSTAAKRPRAARPADRSRAKPGPFAPWPEKSAAAATPAAQHRNKAFPDRRLAGPGTARPRRRTAPNAGRTTQFGPAASAAPTPAARPAG